MDSNGTDETLKNELEKCGRVWIRGAVSNADLELFDKAAVDTTKAGQRLSSSMALAAAISNDSSLLEVIRRLDPKAVPVRIVAFNKSEKANWGVPWHQDRVIAVADKVEVTGFHNWTKKSGTWHCEPRQSILDEMLFVRLHLDDTDQTNGAMEIAVGSHKEGIVPTAMAEKTALAYPIEVCEAKRGDILVLKMLTLHSSKPALIQSGRRVLRIDFSSSELPSPLSWNLHTVET
ncbi:phytanoyl-CoA dioxygenase family protein [Ruegeria sp. 2205SS24-7]|uniref:phytanoyl-CoA dioxygenase family protein n=1 Tax=Ruegeria discodermiae TaxID=3064389 RepID=UPI002742925D|nr:phytanoyl-CoA dioxygenase family protein [Ruegeria sp. 2205SS24-7]MDP5216516.1 phytanoyl-CoA dioxygenase family protein [Ruegeria sp. 2205SS24-7]